MRAKVAIYSIGIMFLFLFCGQAMAATPAPKTPRFRLHLTFGEFLPSWHGFMLEANSEEEMNYRIHVLWPQEVWLLTQSLQKSKPFITIFIKDLPGATSGEVTPVPSRKTYISETDQEKTWMGYFKNFRVKAKAKLQIIISFHTEARVFFTQAGASALRLLVETNAIDGQSEIIDKEIPLRLIPGFGAPSKRSF